MTLEDYTGFGRPGRESLFWNSENSSGYLQATVESCWACSPTEIGRQRRSIDTYHCVWHQPLHLGPSLPNLIC